MQWHEKVIPFHQPAPGFGWGFFWESPFFRLRKAAFNTSAITLRFLFFLTEPHHQTIVFDEIEGSRSNTGFSSTQPGHIKPMMGNRPFYPR